MGIIHSWLNDGAIRAPEHRGAINSDVRSGVPTTLETADCSRPSPMW